MKGPTLTTLALIALVAQVASAQSGFDNEINSELDQMYAQQNMNTRTVNRQGGGQVVGNDEVVEVGDGPNYKSARDGQPIYIYNSATPTANAQTQSSQASVQRQPVTVVQAQPLSDSRAEQIRQARQNAEMNTEMKIVEELEKSRMRDERQRADRLFGDRLDREENYGYDRPSRGQGQQQQQQYQQQNQGGQWGTPPQSNVVPAPGYGQAQGQVQVQTVEVTTEKKKKRKKDKEDDIDQEIRVAVENLEKKDDFYSDRLYVNGIAGFGSYPDAINVTGNFNLGVAVGSQFRDRMLLEGSFVYGNYDIEHVENGVRIIPEITSMDQYTFGGTFKYQILGGMLRPFAGATMAYQYRSFTKTQYDYFSSEASSHAVDLGPVVGADFKLSQDFTIGVDYRYLFNIYSRNDTSVYQTSRLAGQQQQSFGTPIEELSQSVLSLTGRVSF